jgi:hypothetical protein
MTKVLLRLAYVLVVLVLTYLAGSFVAASFDITTWTTKGRAFTVSFGFLFSFAAFAASWIWDHA